MINALGESGARRTLVVVAHPDDETFGTGSLLLHLADHGVTTAVCCASRGEAGELRAGVSAPANGGVPALREAELRSAATALNVSKVFLLDLPDSAMTGTPVSGSIVDVPCAEVMDRIDQVVATFQPDSMVTLDGSDGHRDHARIRDAAVAVGHARGIPVWLHCLPRSLMQSWADLMAAQDPHSPYLAMAEFGTPESCITERIDTTEHYDRRQQAIALHRSQSSPYDALPEDLRRAFLTTENLRPAFVDRSSTSDPDRSRHQHNRSTCHWDHIECHWCCHEGGSGGVDTATLAGSTARS